MKMTELFAKGYAAKAKGDNISRFTQRCRLCGDRMDTRTLNINGVSGMELAAERRAGLIKNEVDCGVTRRLSGYSLTTAGIKEVYALIGILELNIADVNTPNV